MDVVILTGDQDTMQLVSDHVRVLTPAKGANPPVLYGPEEVRNKYGVTPEQIVDYKALVGDQSDNIPGVAGIGPKTASELIQEYGSLDGIYKHLTKIPTNQQTKLRDGKESALLSQDLSRIVTDMSLPTKLDEMEYHGVKTDAVKAKLEELGFKSLVRRIFGDEPKKPKVPDNQMGLF